MTPSNRGVIRNGANSSKVKTLKDESNRCPYDKVRTFAQTCALFLLSGGKYIDSITKRRQMV